MNPTRKIVLIWNHRHDVKLLRLPESCRVVAQ